MFHKPMTISCKMASQSHGRFYPRYPVFRKTKAPETVAWRHVEDFWRKSHRALIRRIRGPPMSSSRQRCHRRLQIPTAGVATADVTEGPSCTSHRDSIHCFTCNTACTACVYSRLFAGTYSNSVQNGYYSWEDNCTILVQQHAACDFFGEWVS